MSFFSNFQLFSLSVFAADRHSWPPFSALTAGGSLAVFAALCASPPGHPVVSRLSHPACVVCRALFFHTSPQLFASCPQGTAHALFPLYSLPYSDRFPRAFLCIFTACALLFLRFCSGGSSICSLVNYLKNAALFLRTFLWCTQPCADFLTIGQVSAHPRHFVARKKPAAQQKPCFGLFFRRGSRFLSSKGSNGFLNPPFSPQ